MPLFIPARIVIWQFLIGIAGAILWGLLGGPRHALAAFVGGGIGAVLSLYFAIKVFDRRHTDPRATAGAFFRAEALKLVLAVVLFSAAAILFADVFIPLITTYAAGLATYWVALLRVENDGK